MKTLYTTRPVREASFRRLFYFIRLTEIKDSGKFRHRNNTKDDRARQSGIASLRIWSCLLSKPACCQAIMILVKNRVFVHPAKGRSKLFQPASAGNCA
jgi:hypothetical protein